TRVGDKPVTKMLELRTSVYIHHVGDAVKVMVMRDGKEVEIEITLEQNPVLTGD
ncbi:MAG: PDZ domain-containing protein, partial [Clostridiales bacterium]|nr:PDZ domain-containing protein [Clostridiales bacterium]